MPYLSNQTLPRFMQHRATQLIKMIDDAKRKVEVYSQELESIRRLGESMNLKIKEKSNGENDTSNS